MLSVEHGVIIPDYEMIEAQYINVDNDVFIFSNIFNEDIMHQSMNDNIVINFMVGEPITRVKKVYDKYRVLPLFYSLGDENSTEVGFTKEPQILEMILPFGTDAQTPRKQPTELIYRARKMKNKFTTE